MFSHITLGTNNLDQAALFYDAVRLPKAKVAAALNPPWPT